jgi:hypothetical protein
MARPTQYDLETLRKLVNSGKSKAEIMSEMEIKNHPTFNNLMLKLMDTDKKYYSVKTARRTKSAKAQTVKIGKRMTLTLSAKLLETSGFKPGDSFAVAISKKKISLTIQE